MKPSSVAPVDPSYLTPLEVARFLHCTDRHIRNLVERGDILGMKVGGVLRIPLVGLEVYVRRQALQAVNQADFRRRIGLSTSRAGER
jgi:excisionase family DNA binding protein